MKVNEIKLQIDVIPSEYRRKNQWKKRELSLLLKSGHNIHLLHVDWNVLNLEKEYFKSDDNTYCKILSNLEDAGRKLYSL